MICLSYLQQGFNCVHDRDWKTNMVYGTHASRGAMSLIAVVPRAVYCSVTLYAHSKVTVTSQRPLHGDFTSNVTERAETAPRDRNKTCMSPHMYDCS